jgi:hypothetical protein
VNIRVCGGWMDGWMGLETKQCVGGDITGSMGNIHRFLLPNSGGPEIELLGPVLLLLEVHLVLLMV